MNERPRNLVSAAAILGASVVIASIVLMGGLWLLIDRSLDRVEANLNQTAATTNATAVAMRDAMTQAIGQASQTIARPYVQVSSPEPLKVRGVADDGGLPVAVSITK
jgi:hypothetical protein